MITYITNHRERNLSRADYLDFIIKRELLPYIKEGDNGDIVPKIINSLRLVADITN